MKFWSYFGTKTTTICIVFEQTKQNSPSSSPVAINNCTRCVLRIRMITLDGFLRPVSGLRCRAMTGLYGKQQTRCCYVPRYSRTYSSNSRNKQIKQKARLYKIRNRAVKTTYYRLEQNANPRWGLLFNIVLFFATYCNERKQERTGLVPIFMVFANMLENVLKLFEI